MSTQKALIPIIQVDVERRRNYEIPKPQDNVSQRRQFMPVDVQYLYPGREALNIIPIAVESTVSLGEYEVPLQVTIAKWVDRTRGFDDNYLSSIEIEDIRTSREERAKGKTKRFSNVNDLLDDLHS